MSRTSGASDLIEVAVIPCGETEKAYRVDAGNGPVWVPKSMCELEDGTLTLPGWLAKEKRMI